jgi:hypothetical protein
MKLFFVNILAWVDIKIQLQIYTNNRFRQATNDVF